MKKLYSFKIIFSVILIYSFFVAANIIDAKSTDSKTALIVAKNFYNQNSQTQITILSLAYTQKTAIGDTAIYYVFNVGQNQDQGWVIVSADDAALPILAYSLTGYFVTDNMPSAFVFWMNNYKTQIVDVIRYNIQPTLKILNEWEYYTSNKLNKLSRSLSSVLPLLKTTWNQNQFYNALCPNGDPTGCVATAMAQILKYWNHPSKGTGKLEYSSAYRTESADFANTTYNWYSMPNKVISSNNAVATLLYHCGVSVKMNYSPKGSGAWMITDGGINPFSAEHAYATYFGYNSATIKGLNKENYSHSFWTENILKPELNSGRPIQYAGTDLVNNNAHSWVLDGYDANTDPYFHMNFGWGGANDGYFNINSINLNSTNSNYSASQQAVIGIKPGNSCIDNFEPNDNSNSATPVFASPLNSGSSNYTLQGNIGWAGDQDWYKINLGFSGSLTINLSNLPFNYDVELYGPNGMQQFIKGSYNSGTTSEQIIYIYSGSSTTIYAKVYPSPNNPGAYTTSSCYDLQFIWTPSGGACTPVSITTQPSNQTATIGSTATFSVSVNGDGPFSYFWFRNNESLPIKTTTNSSSNTNSYTTPTLSANDNGNTYYLNITNCNSQSGKTSNIATLSVTNGVGSCISSLSQTSQNFPYKGGSGSFTINAAPHSGCKWKVSSDGCGLVTITSIENGTGPYSITYEVAPNASNHSQTCTLTVTGDAFTQDYVITQDANTTCYPMPSPTSANFNSSGGSGSFKIDIGSGCYWNITNSCSNILTNIKPTSGEGPATITYNVLPNNGTNERSCWINLQQNNKSHTITQQGTAAPTITVNPVKLTFIDQQININSSPQTYTVNGNYLTSNLLIAAPAGFQVSTNSGSGFNSSLSLVPSSGSVSATIYVRFSPTSVQSYSGIITHMSTGSTQKDVSVSGTGISLTTSASIKPVAPTDIIPGTEFWVDIKVGDPNVITDLFGTSFTLNYNTTYLDYVTAESVNWFGTDLIFYPSNDESTGKTSIGISRKNPAIGVNGSGAIARIKYRLSDAVPANTVLGFTLTAITANDHNGTSIKLSAIEASSTVSSGIIVWAGDANRDGFVDVSDVLILGLYYGLTGAARIGANNSWQGQTCPSSPAWIPASAAHADCNGDGIIDAGDVLAIGLNYSKVHSSTIEYPLNEIEIHSKLSKTTLVSATLKPIVPIKVKKNTKFTVEIKIGDPVVVSNLYGLSSKIKSNSPTCTYVDNTAQEGSFLGGNVIKFFQKVDAQTVDFAITKISSASGVSGSGTVAKFDFISSIDQTVQFTLLNAIANDSQGTPILLDVLSANVIVNVKRVIETPKGYELKQNFPNPFNPTTKIVFDIPEQIQVNIRVYDFLGREVRALVDKLMNPGSHEVEFDASELTSGIYFYKLRAGSIVLTKKLLLLK